MKKVLIFVITLLTIQNAKANLLLTYGFTDERDSDNKKVLICIRREDRPKTVSYSQDCAQIQDYISRKAIEQNVAQYVDGWSLQKCNGSDDDGSFSFDCLKNPQHFSKNGQYPAYGKRSSGDKKKSLIDYAVQQSQIKIVTIAFNYQRQIHHGIVYCSLEKYAHEDDKPVYPVHIYGLQTTGLWKTVKTLKINWDNPELEQYARTILETHERAYSICASSAPNWDIEHMAPRGNFTYTVPDVGYFAVNPHRTYQFETKPYRSDFVDTWNEALGKISRRIKEEIKEKINIVGIEIIDD